MKVIIDEEACIGCGLCAETCPDVFEMKDDKAIAKISTVPDNLANACQEAADGCPVEAITVE